jgi:hypothetical protein
MKIVKFKGTESQNIGRFGVVKPGQELSLLEHEWDDVKDSDDFQTLSAELSEEEKEIAARTLPLGATNYDLRTIPWENRKLHRLLIARLSKKTLYKVVMAIKEVGGLVGPVHSFEGRNILVDRVQEAARLMGWNKLTKEQRLALGTISKEVPPTPSPSPQEDSDGNPITNEPSPTPPTPTPTPGSKAARRRKRGRN